MTFMTISNLPVTSPLRPSPQKVPYQGLTNENPRKRCRHVRNVETGHALSHPPPAHTLMRIRSKGTWGLETRHALSLQYNDQFGFKD